MKKILVSALTVLCAFGMVAAEAAKPAATAQAGQAKPVVVKEEKWDALQLGFWIGVPESTQNSNVFGVKFGLPLADGNGKVYGWEGTLFYSGTKTIKGAQTSFGCNRTDSIKGAQIALVNLADKVNGAQVGIVNCAKKDGVQIGVVNAANDSPFQIGLVCINKDGFLPWFILFNSSLKKN